MNQIQLKNFIGKIINEQQDELKTKVKKALSQAIKLQNKAEKKHDAVNKKRDNKNMMFATSELKSITDIVNMLSDKNLSDNEKISNLEKSKYKELLSEQQDYSTSKNFKEYLEKLPEKDKIYRLMINLFPASVMKTKIITNCIFELIDILKNYDDKINNTFYRRFMFAMQKIRKDIGAE